QRSQGTGVRGQGAGDRRQGTVKAHISAHVKKQEAQKALPKHDKQPMAHKAAHSAGSGQAKPEEVIPLDDSELSKF
ncbi:MAG: hypothetical protein WCN95_08515, partial [bacterium]